MTALLTRFLLASLTVLLSTYTVAAPLPSVRLQERLRAPMPSGTEVTHMASTNSAIWFAGLDHSTEPATPVVYIWSAAGMRQVESPGSVTALHAAGMQVYLLSAGTLFIGSERGFTPVEGFRSGSVRLIGSGSDFVWVVTGNSELWQITGSSRTVAELYGRVEALAVSNAGVTTYVQRTESSVELHTRTADGVDTLWKGLPSHSGLPLSLHADSRGAIWLAWPDKTIDRYLAGNWDTYQVDSNVTAFGEDRDGVVYASTVQAQDQETRFLKSMSPGGWSEMSVPGSRGSLRTLATDFAGGTWFSAGRAGAYRLEGFDDLPWTRSSGEPQGSTPSLLGVSAASATAKAGATKSALPSTGFTPIPGAKASILNTARGLVSDIVSCITTDNDGSVYFGTGYANQAGDPEQAGGGISKWDHRTISASFALSGTTVQACASDPATNYVWFGAAGAGGGRVLRFNPADGTFATFLTGVQVNDIKVKSGSVWVGSFGAGVYRLNATTGATTSQYSVGNNRVTSLVFDNNGVLWAGTNGSGLFWFNGSSPVADNGSFGNTAFIQDLEVDGSGNLWISVWSQGVWRRGAGGYSGPFTIGPSLNRVFQIARDSAGNLWFTHGAAGQLGTPQSGLTFLPANQVNSPAPVPQRFTTANGLPTNLSLAVYPISAMEVWVGQQGGGAYRLGGPFNAPGWPQALAGYVYHSSPVLADLDDNKDLEIIIGDTAGFVTAFRPNGSKLWSYDARSAVAAPVGTMTIQSSPAVADVDGDGKLDVVVGICGQPLGNQPCQGGTIILSNTGTLKRILLDKDITDNPTRTSGPDGYREGVFASPVLSNVDADAEPEIFFGAFDNTFYGFNGDGTKVFPDVNTSDTTVSSAVVADLQNTGQKSIVFGQDFAGGPGQPFSRGGILRGLNPQGQEIVGFPKGNLEQVIWSSPAAVDLDGDGSYELIHGTGLDLSTTNDPLVGQLVYAWRANGTPFLNNTSGRFATTEGRTYASFAVGDVDNDGSPELIIATTSLLNAQNQPINQGGGVVNDALALGQKLYAFRTNGTLLPGFPVRPRLDVPKANLVGSPVLADVNGDGFLDIIVPVGGGLIVFDRRGRVLPGMGLYESLYDETNPAEITSTPAVGDIDNDGILEVVWAPGGVTTGTLQVAKLGPVTNTVVRSWPAFRRAANRNGVFGPLFSVGQATDSGTATLTITAQAFQGRLPISVVANTTSVGGPAALTLVDNAVSPDTVANDGRFFAAVNVGSVAPGRYAIPITVSDGQRSDVQTVFYVKASTGGTTKLLSVSGSLAFGTVRLGETADRTLNILNTGNSAVTISSISSSVPAFTVVQPSGFPQVVQPGATLSVIVRFSPGVTNTGTLTIASDATAVQPSNTLSLSGTATGGTGGCTYTFAPSRLDFDYRGGAGTFQLTASSQSCNWVASSNAAWAQVYPLSGTGNATLQYTAFANFSTRARTAQFNIGGAPYVITEQGAPGTANERFVQQLYYALFGRFPSSGDLALQVNRLTQGTARGQLFMEFLNSPEFNLGGRFIAGLYVGLLARDAEYGGWLFQRNALTSGQVNPFQLVQNFISSAEYSISFGSPSNPDYVRLLYRYILLREATDAEVNFQVTQALQAGTTRAQLASNFLNSAEFRQGTGPRLTTFLLYALLLQRDPSPSERAQGIAAIPQVNGDAQIRALADGILGGAEFNALLQ